jgi:F-box/TPR repeat protein Pof3
VYDSRSAALEKLGRLKPALLDSKQVIELVPDKWQGYARSARLFLALKKPQAAEKMAHLALERVKPGDERRISEIQELQKQIDHELRSEARRRAQHAPHINNLPNELLLLSFEHVVIEEDQAAIMLGQVSRRWRHLVLNAPLLWYSLTIGGQISENKTSKKIDAWIQRSTSKIRHLYVLRSPQGGIMPLLGKVSLRRLEKLVVAIEPGSMLDLCFGPAWDQDQEVELSALRELELLGANLTMGTLLRWFRPVHLRKLRIQARGIRFDALHFLAEGLEEFEIDLTSAPSHEEFFGFLHRTTKLRKLTCNAGVARSDVPRESMPHGLSELQELCIGRSFPALPIFTSLDPSKLQVLRLSFIPVALDPHLNILCDSCESLSLVEFSLVDCRIRDNTCVTQLLTRSPVLQSLQIKLDRAGPILDSLAPFPSVRNPAVNHRDGSATAGTNLPICPQLTHVNFSNCPDVLAGPLVRLVEERLSLSQADETAGSVKAVSSLILDGCPSIEAVQLPRLRKKVPNFSCVYMTKKAASWRR